MILVLTFEFWIFPTRMIYSTLCPNFELHGPSLSLVHNVRCPIPTWWPFTVAFCSLIEIWEYNIVFFVNRISRLDQMFGHINRFFENHLCLAGSDLYGKLEIWDILITSKSSCNLCNTSISVAHQICSHVH